LLGGRTAEKFAAWNPAADHTPCAWVTASALEPLNTSCGTVHIGAVGDGVGDAVGVGEGVGVGAPVGAGVGVGDGVGVGLGVGEGVGVAWTALLTVMVVVSHAPTVPAGRLCQMMFWPDRWWSRWS
jgi:hypothetical protein